MPSVVLLILLIALYLRRPSSVVIISVLAVSLLVDWTFRATCPAPTSSAISSASTTTSIDVALVVVARLEGFVAGFAILSLVRAITVLGISALTVLVLTGRHPAGLVRLTYRGWYISPFWRFERLSEGVRCRRSRRNRCGVGDL